MMLLAVLPLLLAIPAQLPGEDELANTYGERWTPEARVYRAVGPGVVSIDTFLPSPAGLLMAPRNTQLGSGTAVVIHESGLVITNAHVVAPDDMRARDLREIVCRVVFAEEFGGAEYGATILNVDPESDLALLKIDAKGPFHAVPLGRSDDLLKGEKVIAIGAPFRNSHSITSGILSGKHRDVTVRTTRGYQSFSGLLQTDAAINQGNSGGPLLNVEGLLIGINSVTLSGADGIGYAIPVDKVAAILRDRLLDTDWNDRFWAGLRVEESAELGLVIAAIHPRGPAATGGLEVGDRIVEVDGVSVATREDYAAALLPRDAGEDVRFTVSGTSQRRRSVTVSLWPARLRETFGLLGFEAERTLVPQTNGGFRRALRLSRVYSDSGADRLGLRANDVILGVRVHRGAAEPEWISVGSMAELATLVRGPDFELHAENFWILRGEQSYHGRIDFDDPVVRARL
ncbi:MAG TPA: trypsin-like peptidase domain-containing protein [Planctomycetota bacterium]